MREQPYSLDFHSQRVFMQKQAVRRFSFQSVRNETAVRYSLTQATHLRMGAKHTAKQQKQNRYFRLFDRPTHSYFFYMIRYNVRRIIDLLGRLSRLLFAYYSGRQYGCNAVPILNIGILNSFIHSRRVQMPEFSPTISILSLQKTASIS